WPRPSWPRPSWPRPGRRGVGPRSGRAAGTGTQRASRSGAPWISLFRFDPGAGTGELLMAPVARPVLGRPSARPAPVFAGEGWGEGSVADAPAPKTAHPDPLPAPRGEGTRVRTPGTWFAPEATPHFRQQCNGRVPHLQTTTVPGRGHSTARAGRS